MPPVASTSRIPKTRPAKLVKESSLSLCSWRTHNYSLKFRWTFHWNNKPDIKISSSDSSFGDGDGKKKSGEIFRKKIKCFSAADSLRDGWQSGNIFFSCTEAETGTSMETFNLKSVNTATENVIKSELCHPLSKQYRFQLQLYDPFLEAGIRSSSSAHGEQNGALMLCMWRKIDCKPKTSLSHHHRHKKKEIELEDIFFYYRKCFPCCQLPTNTL